MKTSEDISELATALAKAQGQMGSASKSKRNDYQNYNYSDITDIINAAKKPLADNGLSYVQFPIRVEQAAGVVTRLMHISGQWVESEYTLPLDKFTSQSVGSALTYSRRYALQSICGIGGEDDDGQLAEEAAPQPETELEKHLRVLEENREAVNRCKVAIHKALSDDGSDNDWDALVDNYQGITAEDKIALWNPAPTKGGEAWTVAERKALRSDEYNAAKNRWFAKQGEQNEEIG